jgi:hypothetical protein
MDYFDGGNLIPTDGIVKVLGLFYGLALVPWQTGTVNVRRPFGWRGCSAFDAFTAGCIN